MNGIIDKFQKTDIYPDFSKVSARIKKYIKQGADPNIRSSLKSAPIHFAAENGDIDLIEFLVLDHGVPIDITWNNMTLLMLATRRGYSKAVVRLVDLGAKIDATDNKDRTALMHAAIKDNVEVMVQLLRLGAKPPPSEQIERLLSEAQAKARKLLLTYFSKEDTLPGENSLQSLIRLSFFYPVIKPALKLKIEFLLPDYFDELVSNFDAFGQTLFDIALVTRNTEIISVLLDRGVDPLQGKYGLELARKVPGWVMKGRSDKKSLYERMCENAAVHYLGILAKKPESANLPRDMMLYILFLALLADS